MDKMREEFEKWARTEYFDLTSIDGFYSDNETHIAWGAWQAAKSVPDAPDYSVTQLQRLNSLMSELGLSTDESLEGFCLDADRQLSRAITAMHKALSAFKSVPVVPEHIRSIKIPTDAMEQEFQHHYRRGFEAGKKSAQSVPVVGNVIGYLAGGTMMRRQIQGYECKPLVVQPTTSITEAELERLRKDAERYAVVRDSTYCDVYMHEIYLTDDDLDAAIDAAIAGEKK